jgi:hypothetical protein
MTDHHERRVSHKELVLLSFRCRGCGAEISVDLAEPSQVSNLHRAVESPEHQMKCPLCSDSIDVPSATSRPFAQAVLAFLKFRELLSATGREIIFRIPDTPVPGSRGGVVGS